MTRKILIITVIAIITLFSLSEGTTVFDFHASPYSLLITIIDSSTHRSSYGFSVETGFRNYVWRGLSLGGDFRFRKHYFNETSSRSTFSFMARAGWTHKFNSRFSATADLELGLDLKPEDRTTNACFSTSINTRFAYYLKNNISLTAGVELGLSLGNGTKDFSVTPKIGLLISLSRFPFRGAGIGLVMDGKILMGRRSTTPFKNCWTIPGGEFDKSSDSDLMAAALREFMEETAVDFSSLDAEYLGDWTLRVPFFSWTTYFYSISELTQDIVPHEFSDLRWLDPNAIIDGSYSEMDFRPFTKTEMKKLISLL